MEGFSHRCRSNKRPHMKNKSIKSKSAETTAASIMLWLFFLCLFVCFWLSLHSAVVFFPAQPVSSSFVRAVCCHPETHYWRTAGPDARPLKKNVCVCVLQPNTPPSIAPSTQATNLQTRICSCARVSTVLLHYTRKVTLGFEGGGACTGSSQQCLQARQRMKLTSEGRQRSIPTSLIVKDGRNMLGIDFHKSWKRRLRSR